MKTVADIINEQRAAYEKDMRKVYDNAEILNRILRITEPMNPHWMAVSHGTLSVGVSGGYDQFLHLLRELARLGLEPTNPDFAEKKPYYHFFLHRREDDKQESVAWIEFSSTVCKRVKIGTKMVEQDVYEVKCEQTMSDSGV